MASIKLLSEAVRSSLRSGIFLVDFTRVVEELVSVFVSTGSCYLKVVDDGSGISRDGLEMVGERYAVLGQHQNFLILVDLNATSENFGFHGEVLASISEVSLLEIVTKTYGRPNGYRKVLKGCKCFYILVLMMIERKWAPQVLQSIKNCVMRLALVCPNISFKVVDIEREDELFCTHSASSPLSLVTSGFGVEVTSSLHNLEVENDIIKLSGYISGPCNTVDTKILSGCPPLTFGAFLQASQYVYANSQFVCKGPVHKLMRQLANRFEHLNSWNTDEEFRNKKRTRCQPCPAYLLNLSCPRSLYDLAFEPSKTVKVKDWTPILNFIVKAIKQFWEENVACDPSNGATYMVEDQHHFSSIREDVDYLGATIFKEKQSKGDFLLQTGYSGNLLDGSYAKCTSTVMRKHNSLLMHNSNSLLEGDNFFDGEIPAVESFNIDVPFDAPSSSHGRRFHKVEADVINESFEDDLLYNSCSGYGYDVKINEDLQQPFLKRCSTLGSILHEKALFVNDEYELQTDSFWSKQNAEEDYRSGKDLYAHPCPEVTKKLKMSKDSDFLVTALSEENCLPPDLCYSALQIGSSGSDDQLLNFEWHPDYQKPSSQASALGFCHTTDIEDDLGGISRYYKRIHHTKHFDDRETGCKFSYNMSSFANIGFNFDVAGDCGETFNRLVDCGDIHSSKRSDILNKEPDWLLSKSCIKSCKRPNKNKGKSDRFRNSTLEENLERSRRSFSAPPFHRSKRKFFSLNHPSEMIVNRHIGRVSNPAFNDQEAKYPHSLRLVFTIALKNSYCKNSSRIILLTHKSWLNVGNKFLLTLVVLP
ncbi:DNA mismatch repair protein MLH3 [Glycine soja]